MCFTLEPSRMSGTILYAAETTLNDRLLHVMGYQNRAENKGWGPNAMLLPIPSALPMTSANAVDMTSCKHVLRDYEKALVASTARRSRGFDKGMDLSDRSVQVFDSGSYTVVLASDAKYINSALSQVPENKRPKPNPTIFEAYSKLYPGWHIALCCYDGDIDAEPMVWQYEPIDPSNLFAPALDGHNGKPPVLSSPVDRDHSVIVSLVKSPPGKYGLRMPDAQFLPDLSGHQIPAHLQYLFGKSFFGCQLHRQTVNGDVMVSIERLQQFLHGSGTVDFKMTDPPGA